MSKTTDHRMQLMEALYRQYYRRLYLYALTFLDDDEEAHDVVSDMFTSLYEQWQEDADSVSEPSSAQLYARVRNRCIDRVRHDHAQANYAALMSLTQRFDTDDEVRDYERRIARLLQAVDKLPEPGRSILHCTYFSHMTYQQTADALQLTLVQVRKHRLKVFKILHNALKKETTEV